VTEQPHGPGSRLDASDAAPIYLPQRPDLEDRPDATIGHTSLPERIGGDKNWDYRYMGVRNASYTVDALLRPGLHNEVYAAVTHVIGCVRSTGPDLTVFCSGHGDVPDADRTLSASGCRNSRPVRSGNAAALAQARAARSAGVRVALRMLYSGPDRGPLPPPATQLPGS
jgi:hypothetical protein